MTSPAPIDHAELLQTLRTLTEAAGRLVLEVYATDFAVSEKGPGDLVTIADKRANAFLCEELQSRYPGIPIVAEESDPASYANFFEAPAAFFVDPVDGTNEFVARNGEFVVMVGYAEQGAATVGAVHAPTQGRTWFGAPGHGAFEIDAAGQQRALTVSTTSALSEARIVISRSRQSKRLGQLLEGMHPRHILPMGSAGLKAAMVALAEAEAYVQIGSSGCLWDLCAPEAIVTAAGGRYSDARGNPISYQCPELAHTTGLIVSNGRLHERLLAALAADQATMLPPS